MSESVFPAKKTITENCGQVCDVVTEYLDDGLTKRELFAAMAMQGLLANTHVVDEVSANINVAKESESYADALIKALEGGDE